MDFYNINSFYITLPSIIYYYQWFLLRPNIT